VSIRNRLSQVQSQIAGACDIANRSPHEITLIAVSKTRTIDEIKEAYDCGQRHFGESRLREAQTKIENLPKDIVWHFIGPLQSNKAKKVGTVFQVIHTLSSTSQLAELAKIQSPVDGLIEINIADEPQKTGISTKRLDEYHTTVLQCPQVHFRGLMTIGPVMSNAEQMRPYFRELRKQRTRIGAEWLSMGMSGDFEVAIQEGSTHIRVGSAIFGSR